MANHAFNVVDFRQSFQEFANATTYPDYVLSGYFSMATAYISSYDGRIMHGDALQLALNLMTAHLARLMAMAATGGGGQGPVTGGTEGSVSASFAPPPTKSGWQFWLSTTPYGLQLWALLQMRSAGGLMVGGSFERQAFRKAGGVF